ncbi:MAG: class I SAM-dependent methyltransferase [Candidatus Binatia bacterium]
MNRRGFEAAHEAARYDAWYDSPLGAACLQSELALLRRAARALAGKIVLEVGCGSGRFLLALAAGTADAVGVDRDTAMLDLARRHTPGSTAQRCTWMAGDASALPLADGVFDVVFESAVLCFCTDPVAIIREMVRVCRPGGTVLLGELNPYSPWQWWRRLKAAFGVGPFQGASWHWPRDILSALAASGCEVEWVGRTIFSPPVNIENVWWWRSMTEWLGGRFWPWAGAYYVVSGTKGRSVNISVRTGT